MRIETAPHARLCAAHWRVGLKNEDPHLGMLAGTSPGAGRGGWLVCRGPIPRLIMRTYPSGKGRASQILDRGFDSRRALQPQNLKVGLAAALTAASPGDNHPGGARMTAGRGHYNSAPSLENPGRQRLAMLQLRRPHRPVG